MENGGSTADHVAIQTTFGYSPHAKPARRCDGGTPVVEYRPPGGKPLSKQRTAGQRSEVRLELRKKDDGVNQMLRMRERCLR
jgi:hypothetical protein